jgi:tRNA/tmRNA/rRNA uracil-C5-methylase (TrmA/RlmC/RlmD family)
VTEPATATIELHGWAHGGEAVGRLPDGRACFVAGALPGEAVRVAVRTLHKRHATADLLEVVRPSPHRVVPPCPYVPRCGGCQLQHADPAHQLELKVRVVTEQLQRIGRIPDPPVRGIAAPPGGWPAGYRAWARMAVAPDGRLGFRRARSHEVEPIDRCLLLTEAAQALRDAAGDRWAGAEEVALMAGEDAGVVTAHLPGAAGGGPDPSATAPAGAFGVAVRRGRDVVVRREPGAVAMTVDGARVQASAGTFFQAGPAAAELLVRTVVAAADVRPGDRVLDLYAGVGLLGTALARRGARVVAVESNPAATADAVVNARGLDVDVRTGDVAAALAGMAPGDVDVIVLDPPRTGARADVCTAVAATGPRRIVHVACDPAALARDVRSLIDLGHDLVAVDVLDLFGHTAHVEAVATLVPTAR